MVLAYPHTVARIFQSWLDRQIAAAAERGERLTPNSAAPLLGLATNTLGAYLEGTSFPPNTKISALAAVLKFPENELRAITFAQRRARAEGLILCQVVDVNMNGHEIDGYPRSVGVCRHEERDCIVPVGMDLTCTARLDDIVAVDQKFGAIAWVAEDLRLVTIAQRMRAAQKQAQEILSLPPSSPMLNEAKV